MKHTNEPNLNRASLLEHLLNDPLGLLDNYAGDDVIPSADSSGTVWTGTVWTDNAASHDELQELQQLNTKSRKKKQHDVMLMLYGSLQDRPNEGIAKLVLNYLQGGLDSKSQAYSGEINIRFSSEEAVSPGIESIETKTVGTDSSDTSSGLTR
jgi:hypothetical protein